MPYYEKCNDNEIFVGNTKRNGDHFNLLKEKGLKTIRLGKVAYDIEGKPLKDEEGYAPVFINRYEEGLHNEIMMELTFGKNWRRC